MIATLVFVDVIPEYVEAFAEITKYNHENSIKDAGNVRIDVLQDTNDPAHFTLYEVFENEDAIAFHRTTEHYKKWNEAMVTIMAAPRTKVVNTPISFT